MSESHTNPPDNPEKKPSKMRHIEDEKRITHENTAEESRLEHDEITEDESVLRHEDEENADKTALRHEGTDDASDTRDSLLPAIRQPEDLIIPPDVTDADSFNHELYNNEANGTADNQNTNQPDNQNSADPYGDGRNFDIEGKLAGILNTLDRILPEDRDNIGSQAVKHDVLETPAAILGAISEVNAMRRRGNRLFFENKDETDEPVSDGNSGNGDIAETVETAVEAEAEELLALPEPMLALPEPTLALTDGSEAAVIPDDEKDFTSIDINTEPSGEKKITVEIGERDYYEVLGIGRDADEGEIKTAYRSLAKKYHPDVNSGDLDATEKFKEVNKAYSVLIDPEKRKVYDQKTGVQPVKPDVKTGEKSSVKPSGKKGSAVGEADAVIKTPADGKNDKTPASGKSGGKRKDRFMRRVLDGGFIFSQAAARLMPDEQKDEDSGTKGVRSMIAESAKLVKIFATAERKPKKPNHEDEDERLTHEDTPEESGLQHEEAVDENALQHGDLPALEAADGEVLQLEAPRDNLLEAGETLAIGDGGDNAETNADIENRQNTDESTALVPIEDADEPQGGDTIISDDGGADIDISDADIPGVPLKSKADIKIENKIDKNIDKYTAEAAKLEKKIEKAEKKIPKKKVKKSKLVHDDKGKPKREISFADEKIAKADAKWNQGQSKTLGANAGRYVTGHASAFVHGKISESENLTGNTGLKAVHSAEKGAVKTYAAVKSIHRYVKNAPYRRLQHLKAAEIKNKGKLAYQQLLKDKPELRGKPLAKLLQKRRIKKEYAKAFRYAQSGGSKMAALGKVGAVVGVGAAAVSGDGKALAKMGAQLGMKIAFKKAGLALVKAAAPILLKIGLFLLIIGAILLLFTMCASLFSSTTSHVLDAISYTADADDITAASVYMTQLEVELKEEIIEAASDMEGLHEFRLVITNPGGGGTDIIFEGTLITEGLGHPYFEPPVYAPPDFDPLVLLPFLTGITHNPFELMAYLTTAYGDFTGHDINAIIKEIFDTAYSLTIVESFEVRTATVEAWYYELQDLGGMQDLGGFVDGVWVSNWQWVSDWQNVRVEPFSEPMNYNWYFREVSLTINSTISDVIKNRLNDDQQEQYAFIMESLGLRQFVGSPFENNWLGAVSSIYGYRFHPITMTREMHNGIDIAMPEGTPIMGGIPGTVVFAGDNGGYGNFVVIEFIDPETGHGVQVRYAHLHEINVAVGDEVEVGDIIGTVGSTGTSTGNHLHLEVRINENGGEWRFINPVFFVEPFTS